MTKQLVRSIGEESRCNGFCGRMRCAGCRLEYRHPLLRLEPFQLVGASFSRDLFPIRNRKQKPPGAVSILASHCLKSLEVGVDAVTDAADQRT